MNDALCKPPLADEVHGIARSVARYEPEPDAEGTAPPQAPPPDPATFLREEPRNVVRLRTGFETLDRATRGGIPTGIVTAVLGAPHTGKTALVSQIAIRAASEGYLVVILFKDEGRFAGAKRLEQQLGLDRARLENQEPAEIDEFAGGFLEHDIRLPDGDSQEWTLENLIAWTEVQEGGGPRLIIVDSIQSAYARCAEEKRTLREAIEAKMRLLEGAAKRGALVIVTSEMNRSAYRNKDDSDNIRGIAAGAESRAIEYVSRLILALEGDAAKVVTAKIEKNSPGRKRPFFKMKLDPATARFREIREDEVESIADDARRAEEEARRAKVREKIRKTLRAKADLNVRGLEQAVGGDKVFLADVGGTRWWKAACLFCGPRGSRSSAGCRMCSRR